MGSHPVTVSPKPRMNSDLQLVNQHAENGHVKFHPLNRPELSGSVTKCCSFSTSTTKKTSCAMLVCHTESQLQYKKECDNTRWSSYSTSEECLRCVIRGFGRRFHGKTIHLLPSSNQDWKTLLFSTKLWLAWLVIIQKYQNCKLFTENIWRSFKEIWNFKYPPSVIRILRPNLQASKVFLDKVLSNTLHALTSYTCTFLTSADDVTMMLLWLC